MSNLIHAIELGVGALIGWGANAFGLRLSEKIQGFISSFNIEVGKAEWIAWLMAVAIALFIAGGGVALPKLKGIDGAASHIGYVVAGAGLGILADELLNAPSASSLTGG